MSRNRRRYRKREDRRVWVFSEPNTNLRPADIARVLAVAAFRAAEREAAARQQVASESGEQERPDER